MRIFVPDKGFILFFAKNKKYGEKGDKYGRK